MMIIEDYPSVADQLILEAARKLREAAALMSEQTGVLYIKQAEDLEMVLLQRGKGSAN